MAKTKFFRVMTEGATTDGRKIPRKWIEQMAANYDPALYGARIWLEHLRGMWPDSEFRAYGDVLALESRTVEDGKLALFAQFDVTDDLIAINKKRQKIYSSAEVSDDFAETGEAYLVGMAFTDSPASLGTEMLQFSAQAKDNPLAARKQHPDNLFTAATPFIIELEDDMKTDDKDTASKDGGTKTLLSKITGILSKDREDQKETVQKHSADVGEAMEALATAHADLAEKFSAAAKADKTTIDALTKQVETLSADLKKVTDDFAAFRDQLDNTEDDGEGRSKATGGDTKDPDAGL